MSWAGWRLVRSGQAGQVRPGRPVPGGGSREMTSGAGVQIGYNTVRKNLSIF
jgi:hypothetical protein